MISGMTRRRGPIPGVPQRNNAATFDPTSGESYRTTLSFAPVQRGALETAAKACGLTTGKLLVRVAARMDVDGEGRPRWATTVSPQARMAEYAALFARQPGRPFRPTVEFPAAVGDKLVTAAKEAGVTVAEVMRVEVGRYLRLQAGQHDQAALQARTPVQLELPAVAA
jgi:hypothetical protein